MKGGKQMTITIKYGHEFKINRNEDICEDNFFYPIYEQALNQLEEIVKYGEAESIKSSQDYLNNIIAFCGERGQGKSSAMLSFSDALKNAQKKNSNEFSRMISGLNRNFYVLDSIDPTQMETNENIISIILSKMFVEFKKTWENRQSSKQSPSEIAERNDLLEKFRKCYSHIQTIKAKSESLERQDSFEESLQELLRLGDSSKLKEDIGQILKSFFKLHTPNYRYMLVLQIDDTDLNIHKAYEIVEDLRKYFSMPDVVILMASKIEQLCDIVEQQVREDYAVLLRSTYATQDKSQNNSARFRRTHTTQDEPHQIAAKYIGKLIPENRRIYLPEPSAIPDRVDEKITIRYIKVEDGKEIDILGENTKKLRFQDRIHQFIFRKIGIRFSKPETGASPIIPKTMRGLVDLLAILSRLEDYGVALPDTVEAKVRELDNKRKLHNLLKFEQYFLKNWVSSNIDKTYAGFLLDLASVPTIEKHRRIITDIYNILENSDEFSLYGREDRRKGISETKRYQYKDKPSFYSVGDVMDALVKLEDMLQLNTVDSFCFAVRILYTITMHKLYFRFEPVDRTNDKEYFTLLDEFIGGDLFGKENSKKFFPRYRNSKQDRGCFSVEDHRALEGNLFDDKEGWNNQKLYVYECLKGDENLIYKQDRTLKNTRFTAVHFWVSIRFVRRATFRYKWKHPHESYMLLLNMDYLWQLVRFQTEHPNREKGKAEISTFLKQFYRNARQKINSFDFTLDDSDLVDFDLERMREWLTDIMEFDHGFLDDLFSLTFGDSSEHRVFNTSAYAKDFRTKDNLLRGMSSFQNEFDKFVKIREALYDQSLYDEFIQLRKSVENQEWNYVYTKEYKDLIKRLVNSLEFNKGN
jgi:hypothetical protein